MRRLVVGAAVLLLAGCGAGQDDAGPTATTAAMSNAVPTRSLTPTPSPGSPSSAASTPFAPAATPTPPTPAPPAPPAATPAPDWLGTRALGPAGAGPVAPQPAPPELVDRRIAALDVLPPPPGDAFVSTVAPVPDAVLARSTWQAGCPVTASELRYLTVAFWGFDQRPHTGELLAHADAADVLVNAFAVMHAERFPLEEVRIIRADELDAQPTGDGNVTSVFVCRPVTGGSGWSQHAFGRAIDVNPFHNPYERGSGASRVVLPELATAYTDRSRDLPGTIDEGSGVVAAFRAAGWSWGGTFRTLKDWQHFSATGR